jgi:peroxiredoxin Q/BCP
LNFPLLSDINKEVSKEYGVYSPKGYDKRVTFILDKKGNIAKIINVTNIEKHAAEVFNFAMKLK